MTDVTFSYTFTKADAAMKKVTFRVVVSVLDNRDALPGDNEVIALPTSVKK
jgi:hypothetical protein